ncbi:MAG: hypothetical protein SF028_01680 [Candidatus Sumerlaeia bacterium]|nr:hypothetical protein [Candidatus Sumerlaeia bacterium]
MSGDGRRLLKRGRTVGHPSIWVEERPTGPVLVKTWEERPRWERATLGRWLAGREAAALRAAAGIPGVPGLFGRPMPWRIEMELLAGTPFPTRHREGKLPPAYFDRLWAALAEMHRRGVNHGDVRRKNLLVLGAGRDEPGLFDFTQSLLRSGPAALAWSLLVAVDRVRFLQLKRESCSDGLAPEELREWEARPWFTRLGHWLRARVYRPLKHAVFPRGKRKPNDVDQ